MESLPFRCTHRAIPEALEASTLPLPSLALLPGLSPQGQVRNQKILGFWLPKQSVLTVVKRLRWLAGREPFLAAVGDGRSSCTEGLGLVSVRGVGGTQQLGDDPTQAPRHAALWIQMRGTADGERLRHPLNSIISTDLTKVCKNTLPWAAGAAG